MLPPYIYIVCSITMSHACMEHLHARGIPYETYSSSGRKELLNHIPRLHQFNPEMPEAHLSHLQRRLPSVIHEVPPTWITTVHASS